MECMPEVQVQASVSKMQGIMIQYLLALHQPGKKLRNRFSGPWPTGYAFEFDESPEVDPVEANSTSIKLESGTGLWSWKWWISLLAEILSLASLMAILRDGHLDIV